MTGVLTRWLDKRLYPQFSRNWDDKLFREHILVYLGGTPKDVLDIGAGAGIVEQMNFRDHVKSITGIDPDIRVLENPYLHKAVVGYGETLPFADNSFDVVFADNVMEHLPDPEKVFAEIARVLRPGGGISW